MLAIKITKTCLAVIDPNTDAVELTEGQILQDDERTMRGMNLQSLVDAGRAVKLNVDEAPAEAPKADEPKADTKADAKAAK